MKPCNTYAKVSYEASPAKFFYEHMFVRNETAHALQTHYVEKASHVEGNEAEVLKIEWEYIYGNRTGPSTEVPNAYQEALQNGAFIR